MPGKAFPCKLHSLLLIWASLASLVTAQDGACCVDSGACVVVSEAICTTLDGIARAPGTTCSSDTCLGACCLLEKFDSPFSLLPKSCDQTDNKEACELRSGTFRGPDSTCETPGVCVGACCQKDNEGCLYGLTEPDCNGEFRGIDTTCEDDNICDGACCLQDAGCVVVDPESCHDELTGTPQGATTKCEDTECPDPKYKKKPKLHKIEHIPERHEYKPREHHLDQRQHAPRHDQRTHASRSTREHRDRHEPSREHHEPARDHREYAREHRKPVREHQSRYTATGSASTQGHSG